MITFVAYLLFAQTAPSPETLTALTKAEHDVSSAVELQRVCKTVKTCDAANKLVSAAEDALTSIRKLAGVKEADPFDALVEPFADMTVPPSEKDIAEMVNEGEANAALSKLAAVMGDLSKQ
jgi:hypothetical protein